jgi:hypothetical protein
MCDNWGPIYWPTIYPWPRSPIPPAEPFPLPPPFPVQPPRQEELEEFRRLLERARKYDRDKYDRDKYEPDCELEEKRNLLKQMAEKLGIDISFVDAEKRNL